MVFWLCNNGMEYFFEHILADLLSVVRDVAPVLGLVFFFQLAILRKPVRNTMTVFAGIVAVITGLFIFLAGLDMSVFPVGESLAVTFADPEKMWQAIIFAFFMGYATTVAEPALLAVTMRAENLTAGNLNSFALRNVVAFGVGVGLALGVWRIFRGDPLWIYILAGYVAALSLTWFSPKEIVPLAYDSGGVTTSTITVPLVAALGLGLASNIPGRDPMIDGFGLIAFASVFPMISVLGYALVVSAINKNRT